MSRHEFLDILVWFLLKRRPYQSDAEQAVLDWFRDTYGFEETAGGVIRYGEQHPHIWLVAHADTVGSEGDNWLHIDEHYIQLDPQMVREVPFGGICLGADDGAGLAILAMLSQSRRDITLFVPYGEERGGIGSYLMCQQLEPEQRPSVVISLDRGGTSDVVTHQSDKRTCSDAFAWALARYLPSGYRPCADGIFTDSAVFAAFGSRECTNLSVGFYQPHSTRERLYWSFTYTLAQQLEQVPFERLPILRSFDPYTKLEEVQV